MTPLAIRGMVGACTERSHSSSPWLSPEASHWRSGPSKMPKLAHRVTMPKPGDQRIIDAYAGAIRKGHPNVTAATLAGISTRTASEWMLRGEAEADAYDATQDADSDAYDPDAVLGSHVPFLLAVRAAEASSVDAHLGVFDVISDKPGHWQRSAWYLERKYAGTFGMRQHTTIDQRVAVVHIADTLGPGQRAALLAQLQEQLGERTDDNSADTTPLLPAPSDTNTDA